MRSGSERDLRTWSPIGPKRRLRCHCGCGGKATRYGLGNGVALTAGCELFIARWVRDPEAARAAVLRTAEAKGTAALAVALERVVNPGPEARAAAARLKEEREAEGWITPRPLGGDS